MGSFFSHGREGGDVTGTRLRVGRCPSPGTFIVLISRKLFVGGGGGKEIYKLA